MSRRIDLALRMLSDWRIGTGTGAHGYADRLVDRDPEDGLPHVPAKSMNGVWRDGCEVAAHALDGGPAGPAHAWVVHLFGGQRGTDGEAPIPGALVWDGALRYPADLRRALAANDEVRAAVTLLRPGVEIDPETGAAADRKVRFEEFARGGVTLTGAVTLPDGLDEAQDAAARAVLWAGARLVEGVGAKRRRGAGRCRLDLAPAPDRWEDALRGGLVPPPAPRRAGRRTGRPTGAEYAAGDGWERAALTLTLTAPLLAHDRTIGNHVLGRDHAPGWMLLPEVLRRLGPTAAAAARRGDLVVTAATPVVGGRRGLPVPRVLFAPKAGGDRLVNRALAAADGPAERLRAGYVPDDPDEFEVHRPRFVTRMHNTIEDGSQRPTRAIGGVYAYRALAAGTVLAAEVRVRGGVLDGDWAAALGGDWRLGRSRKDDYGLATAEVGAAAEPRPRAVGGRLRVWLLSDLLLRDARLGAALTADAVAAELGRALGAELTPVAGNESIPTPADDPARVRTPVSENGTIPTPADDPARVRTPVSGDRTIPTLFEIARTESWHTGWGLPRPTLLGLAAGGCLTFDVRGEVDAAALAEVETAGLGLRRGEGFGQIRVNAPLLERPTLRRRDRTDTRPAPVRVPLEPGTPAHAAARIVERAAWRAEIWRAAERAAADDALLEGLTGLTPTRLNALRRLLDAEDVGPRIDRLVRRWDDAARIGERLRVLLAADTVWTALGRTGDDLAVTADGAARLRRELLREARRSLLTACLAAHTRRRALTGEGS
ncbi:RAMP superfamily CRISPR-associated protein [Actinomadura atramentaria]|uniref:RAMP superfamily CRISPR-associated protein n=1 Tax=Actinomadura atramentaria TaxID=1990 RepID=UPI00036C0DCA|nr:RAMP superfamily CRISPR-associated protein [Actinomadura atramentaria]